MDTSDARPVRPHIDMTRFAAGRLRAAEEQPFLAVALYALSPTAAPGTGTMGVDRRWRLRVDPDVVERWSIEEIAGVLLHEVAHVVRDHHGRGESAYVLDTEWPLWNIAGDAEINDDLRDDAVTLPADPVFPESIGAPPGRSAEHYFHLLRTGAAHLPEHAHACGAPLFGAADPPPRPGDPLAGVTDADEVVAGIDETEAHLIRHRVAVAVASSRGKLPGLAGGGWDRWAEAQLTARLDWRTVLRARIRGAVAAIAGAADYTYGRPSRRRIPGVVLPAMRRPVPLVAIVIDTSGSVDDEMLGTAWTEVHGCLTALGVRRDLLSVYAVDTEVHRLRPPYRVSAALTGGGGTDMGAGIDAAVSARPRPQLVVVITDGYTPWPAAAPPCRVVVALLECDDPDDVWTVPGWAHTVVVPQSATTTAGSGSTAGGIRS